MHGIDGDALWGQPVLIKARAFPQPLERKVETQRPWGLWWAQEHSVLRGQQGKVTAMYDFPCLAHTHASKGKECLGFPNLYNVSAHNFHFKYDASLRKGTINSPCLQSRISNKRCALLQSSEDWLQGLQHTVQLERAKSTWNRAGAEKKKCKANSLCRPREAYGYLKPGCLDATAAAWHGTTYGNYIKAA